MAAEWHYTKDGEQHGPVSASELKAFASSGTLVPTDMVRKEGMAEWKQAGKINGLFSPTSVPATNSPKVPPDLPQMKVPPTLPETTNRQSLADAAKSAAKGAAQYAAKQTERTKLVNLTLPSLYQSLGRHAFSSPDLRTEFAEVFQQLDQVQAEQSEIKSRTPVATKSLGDKAKAMAGQAMDAAQAQKLSLRQSSLFGTLGKAVYDKHEAARGPQELVKPITMALDRLTKLDSDIHELSATREGSLVTPKRLVLCFVAGLLCMIAFSLKRGSINNQQAMLIAIEDDVVPNSWNQVAAFPFEAYSTECSTNSYELLFSPNADFLLFSGENSPLTRFPISTSSRPQILNEDSRGANEDGVGWGPPWSSLQLTSDGRTLLGIASKRLATYSISSREKKVLDIGIDVDYVRLSPKGDVVLLRESSTNLKKDGTIVALSFPKLERISDFQQADYARRVPFSFSHDGDSFVQVLSPSSHSPHSIIITSISNPSSGINLERPGSISERSRPSFPLFSHDDRYVIVRWGNQICVYNAVDGSIYKTFLGSAGFGQGEHLPSLYSIAVSPNQHCVAMTGGASQFLGIWNYELDKMVFIPASKARTDACCFSPKGGAIGIVGEDGVIQIIQGVKGDKGKYKFSSWVKDLYTESKWLTKWHVGSNQSYTDDVIALWGAGTCFPERSYQCGSGTMYYLEQHNVLSKYVGSLGNSVLKNGQIAKWQISSVGVKLFVGFDESILANPDQLRQSIDAFLQPFATGIGKDPRMPDGVVGQSLSGIPNGTVNIFVCSSDLKTTYARAIFRERPRQTFTLSNESWNRVSSEMTENFPLYSASAK
jgi:hypothetical protein